MSLHDMITENLTVNDDQYVLLSEISIQKTTPSGTTLDTHCPNETKGKMAE